LQGQINYQDSSIGLTVRKSEEVRLLNQNIFYASFNWEPYNPPKKYWNSMHESVQIERSVCSSQHTS
jgi:hypothetical protein